jgi:hypothetical protein
MDEFQTLLHPAGLRQAEHKEILACRFHDRLYANARIRNVDWLVEIYKNNLSSEIGKGGIDGLIKTLEEKNAKAAGPS